MRGGSEGTSAMGHAQPGHRERWRSGRLTDDRYSALFDGTGSESDAIGVGAGKGEEDFAGLYLAGVVGKTRHGERGHPRVDQDVVGQEAKELRERYWLLFHHFGLFGLLLS
jgi:hypothetical protein